MVEHKKNEHQTDQKTERISHSSELDILKNEILYEVEKDQKKFFSWGSVVVTIVLITLSLLSIIQTIQSATILNKIENGNFGSGATTTNLQGLPDMVGGC